MAVSVRKVTLFSLPIAEAYFNISLSHRKAEIRKLIENAITDMMERDEGEEESEYSENDA